MRRYVFCLAALLALVGLLALVTLAPSSTSSAAGPWIGVSGNRLVDRNGKTVRLLGVNRSSADYECLKGERVFEGPTDWASVQAMKSWRINVVRIPLNESCWLGIGEVAPAVSGEAYRAAIRGYVEELERAGLYVILDLHWAAPGAHTATGLIPLPDAEHTPDFWRSLATEYRNDRSVIFDLYNEPHDVTWECWSGPCKTYDKWFGWYQSVGLPELLAVVRSTGARQPVMLGGLNWAADLRGWLAHLPEDPAKAIVAANHTYDYAPCYSACRKALIRVARKFPVVTGELGERDCRHRYVDPYMRWADAHGISYLGWAWDAGEEWTCDGGPSLIRDYSGAPTRFGVGFRRHLQQLAAQAIPPAG